MLFRSLQRGILTNPNGKVMYIPASMVKDKFGMAGLLAFIRAAESESNTASLALGVDLTTLGLDVNTIGSLYSTFCGPWNEGPIRAEDIDYHVPWEYNISDPFRVRKFGSFQFDSFENSAL